MVAGKNLGSETKDVRNVITKNDVFPAPLAMNVVPWAGSLSENDYTSEELKVRNESRKILGKPELKVHATCVRVPVVTTHSLAVHAVLDRAVTADEVRALLVDAEGVVVTDDPANKIFPNHAPYPGRGFLFGSLARGSLNSPRNKPIAHHFSKGVGLRLQHTDSILVSAVLDFIRTYCSETEFSPTKISQNTG